MVPSYDDAELVVVNACGHRQRGTGVAGSHPGRPWRKRQLIVTGCLGAKEPDHGIPPQGARITGPTPRRGAGSRSKYVEKPTLATSPAWCRPTASEADFPRHYALSEDLRRDCNHRCTFCIIPSMRGSGEPPHRRGTGRGQAPQKEAGVKEILVISQDASASVAWTIRHRTGFP